MKPTRIALSLVLLLAATTAIAQTEAQNEFNQIESLSGAWAGKDSRGMPVQVSYRVTANGSAIMSEIESQKPGHDDMITMFNMDGIQRLLMTHYCSAGNQPRLVASRSPDGKSITFNFVDATNLASPDAGHMQRVVFTFVDATHHIEEWHFKLPGKEIVQRFDLQKMG
jgi:hypothetical protein